MEVGCCWIFFWTTFFLYDNDMLQEAKMKWRSELAIICNYIVCKCLQVSGKAKPAKLQSIHLHCTRLSFQKTSTTFRSDAGAFLKHGDKHLMQSRYWLWSVPAVLLRRNCRFGFNAKFVHQLWTKQREEGSFSLTVNNAPFFPGANMLRIGQNSQQFFFSNGCYGGGPPQRGLWWVQSQDLESQESNWKFGAQFLGYNEVSKKRKNTW